MTQTVNEALDEIRTARTLALMAARAETLFQRGYTMEEAWPGLYHVFGPGGQHYMVTIDTIISDDCTCPAFEKWHTCKHFLAVQKVLKEQEATAPQEMGEAEWGCDPHSEY
jgi:hypothetical protein